MKQDIKNFISNAIKEDIGLADITSEACIKNNILKTARIISKEKCIIAGIIISRKILNTIGILSSVLQLSIKNYHFSSISIGERPLMIDVHQNPQMKSLMEVL